MSERVVVPSWQSLLKALLIAMVFSSAVDVAIQYWRTPLGWTPQILLGVYLVTVVIDFLLAAVVGLLVGLPLARLAVRKGWFRAALVTALAIVLGFLTEIALSALGNTYRFMSGIAFWQSFWVAGFGGGLAGYLWWWQEKQKAARRNA